MLLEIKIIQQTIERIPGLILVTFPHIIARILKLLVDKGNIVAQYLLIHCSIKSCHANGPKYVGLKIFLSRRRPPWMAEMPIMQGAFIGHGEHGHKNKEKNKIINYL